MDQAKGEEPQEMAAQGLKLGERGNQGQPWGTESTARSGGRKRVQKHSQEWRQSQEGEGRCQEARSLQDAQSRGSAASVEGGDWQPPSPDAGAPQGRSSISP